MQNEEINHTLRKKYPVKSCCLLGIAAVFGGFLLVLAAFACFVLADSVEPGNEDYTLSQRMKRYHVACQFIWADFKDWVSRKTSGEQPDEDDSSL